MKPDEYADLLNLLLECERAGAKLLAAYIRPSPARAALQEMCDSHLANSARCDDVHEETRLAG